MKLFKIFTLIGLLGLFACGKDNSKPVPTCEDCNFDCTDPADDTVLTNNCKDNFDCIFEVTANASFDDNEFNGVGSGNKNVFEITSSTQGSAAIADDEFDNILVFELAAEQESFDVEGADLELLNAHFRRVCFCAETDFKKATGGCLQGLKDENGNWFVQGNLEITYSWGVMETKFDVSAWTKITYTIYDGIFLDFTSLFLSAIAKAIPSKNAS
jgi:hypothetical protein